MFTTNDGMVSAHKKIVWLSFITFERTVLMDFTYIK